MSDSLCINNQMVCLPLLSALNNMIYNFLLIIIVFLRKQYILSSVGNAAPQSNISCMPPHNLNNTAALVG